MIKGVIKRPRLVIAPDALAPGSRMRDRQVMLCMR